MSSQQEPRDLFHEVLVVPYGIFLSVNSFGPTVDGIFSLRHATSTSNLDVSKLDSVGGIIVDEGTDFYREQQR